MSVSDKQKALDIIQKCYDLKILSKAKKQYSAIVKFLKEYDPECLKNVYGSLGKARKELIKPVDVPDELYAELWQKVEYEHKSISESVPLHFTGKNERVRSKSEVIIADALARAGVPYRYEYPLKIDGQIIHPDFMVLRKRDRKEFFWEHLGLIDDSEYRNKALTRLLQYEKEGFFPGDKLIITAETIKQPLNADALKRVIKHYLL